MVGYILAISIKSSKRDNSIIRLGNVDKIGFSRVIEVERKHEWDSSRLHSNNSNSIRKQFIRGEYRWFKMYIIFKGWDIKYVNRSQARIIIRALKNIKGRWLNNKW